MTSTHPQATIYVTQQAMATVTALEGLDHYERALLAVKPETDLSHSAGYYLNVNSLHLAVLPADADVAVRLTPANATVYQRHISFPPELRGVVFSGAPRLPDNYAAILNYWSQLEVSDLHQGAQYCQNVQNEYLVSFDGGHGGDLASETDDHPPDLLLSNGLVVCIRDIGTLVAGLKPEQYIELQIPINADMLGADLDGFDAAGEYHFDPDESNPLCERIFLKVQDILASPDADLIAIAAVHTELWDYGFYY